MADLIKRKFNNLFLLIRQNYFVWAFILFLLLSFIPSFLSYFNLNLPSTVNLLYKAFLLLLLLGFTIFLIKINWKICQKKYQILIALGIVIILYTVYFFFLPNVLYFISPSYTYRPNFIVVVKNSFLDNIKTLIQFYSFIFFVFFFIFLSEFISVSKKEFAIYLYFFEAFVIIASFYFLYSYIKTGTADNASYFGNKNTFGFYLLGAMVSSHWLIVLFRKRYQIFFSLYFFILAFISKSTTSFVLCFLLLILTFIYFYKMFIFNTKLKKIFFISLISCLVVIVLIATCTSYRDLFISFFKKFFSLGSNRKTKTLFSGRDILWSLGFDLFLNPRFFMLGYGETLLTNVVYNSLYSAAGTNSLVNGFLTVLVEYGLIGFCLFLFLIYFLLRKFVINHYTFKKLKISFIYIFVLVAIYMFFETYYLCAPHVPSLFFTPLISFFPLCYINAVSSKQNYFKF